MKEQDSGVKWFNTTFYPRERTARAVRYEDGVLSRLRSGEVTLFTPWGPRYKWESRGVVVQEGDKEVEVLNFFAAMLSELSQNMPEKKFRWVFLGADLYGTRINNLPSEVVVDYFTSLAGWLKQVLPIAEFQLWSEFNELAEKYREEIRDNFGKFVSQNVLARAEATARAMGRNSSAGEYIIERLAEAMLMEDVLKPIKVSCVARHKDDGVDGELPRLYFLPERLHAPWL